MPKPLIRDIKVSNEEAEKVSNEEAERIFTVGEFYDLC
jgi:hypothetical protein